jgi:hypothetical protein
MISTATKILLKRSGVPGRVPSLADLKLGELGINYSDGEIYFRQENDIVGSRIIKPAQGDIIGKTIFVTVEGNDNNSGLNERDAKKSIKAAAKLAEPGDSIKVYPGQYIEDNPIRFLDRVSVEGMELRNVLVTPANPDKDLYQVGDGFHATNHSFVSNQDSEDGAAIITFRPLEGTASDRYFDAARLIRDNLEFISNETVGFLTSGYSGYAADQRSQDGSRAIELNADFIVEEAFQYINSPDYTGPSYNNPNFNQCRSDLRKILSGWRYDLISDGNSETTGVGLTYYAPIEFVDRADISDLVYDNKTGLLVIETAINTGIKPGDEIKLQDIRLDCNSYNNDTRIINCVYDNVSGIATVTLPLLHDIQATDTIKLSGLEFDCPPYGAESYNINNFVYDETSGSSRISLDRNHALKAGDSIELRNIQFDCPPYGGEFTDIVNLDYNNISGTGVITYATPADLAAGDRVFLYDITLSCPAYDNAISVVDFEYDNFTGVSQVEVASPHNLRPGDLIKLENLKFSCDSYLDEDFNITAFDYNNLTGLALVTLNKDHSFNTSQKVELSDVTFSCNSYIPSAKTITNFQYTADTGISTVTLHSPHELRIGDSVRLEDISFACNSYSFTNMNVTDAPYDEVTGFVTIVVDRNHGKKVGDRVKLDGLEYSCVNSGITTTLFPDGTFGNEFEILDVPNAESFIINVGSSTIEHTYVQGGTATVGITTSVFPDGTQGFNFEVVGTPDNLNVELNVGVSTIAHTYDGGGNLFVGFTTTVFPDGTRPDGNKFDIIGIPAANQLELNVGISTIAHDFAGSGTVSNPDNFKLITNIEYNAAEGTGLITLPSNHNLVVGDNFVIEDAKFSCDSYRSGAATTLAISDFNYDELTGESTITLSENHDLVAGDTISLFDIEFSCNSIPAGLTTTIFPDGSVENFYPVLSTPDPTTIITRVGVSTIAHTYDSGGFVQVGITTNIFPDGTRSADNIFGVAAVPAPNQLLTNIGVSSIAHTYVGGGKFYTGITTNIFPQTFTDPNVSVATAAYDNLNGVLTVRTNRAHGLTAGSSVLLQNLEWSCLSGGAADGPGSLIFPRNQEVYTVTSVLSTTEYTCNIGTNDIPHTYVRGGTSSPQNITNAVYDEKTGLLTVTTNIQHGYNKGDTASVVDLVFSCLSGGENNAPGNLIFPRPSDIFTVVSASGNQVTLNVGASANLAHTYTNGGSLSYNGNTVQVTAAVYDEATGVLIVTTSSPLGVSADDEIVMQGLRFVCNSGGPGNDAGALIFPRLDAPSFNVVNVVDGVTYTINVGKSTLIHTYVSGGFSSLKKKANDRNLFPVLGVPTPTSVITNVGTIPIAHDYVSGGNLFVGITTNIFPDGTRGEGSSFEVVSALSPNQAVIRIGVSSIPHNYESGGRMQYGDTNERTIIDFQYANQTGLSTVTVRGAHGLQVGDNVKLDGLEFECVNSPGITTTIFPDGTSSSLNIYPVTRIINNSIFETNVGAVGFKHTYLRGGSAFVGITTNIFPDGTLGYDYTVSSVVSPTDVIVNVGVSSIQHNYIRGGQLFSGKTNEREIFNFNYDNTSGLAILTFRQPENNLFTGDLVKLDGLRFECPDSNKITTNIFPDGTIGNLFQIKERLNPTQYQLNIGRSDIVHNYVRGTGSAFVGITTNIFPDVGTAPGKQPSKLFPVVNIPSPNQVAVRIGVSSIPHTYSKGGSLSVGINTDIFPGNSDVSPKGDTFTVQQLTSAGELVINVGLSSIAHNYANGGQVLFGQSAGGELQHITGPGVKQATVAAINFEKQISQYAINNRPWGSFIAAETSIVTEFLYDNVTGFATVTAPGINVQRNDTVRMSDIQFRCSDEYAGLTTTFFPDDTRPGGNYFDVENRIDEDNFEVFVGVSSIAHRYLKGGNVYRYRQNVADIDYDKVSGIASVYSIGHGFNTEDIVELGDAKFDCPVFTPDYLVENFDYNNATGISVVTTTVENDIEVGDRIKLDNLKFECPPYGNSIDISEFTYDNLTGISSLRTIQPHGINPSPRFTSNVVGAAYSSITGILTVTTNSTINLDDLKEFGVQLRGLEFSCDSIPPGITTTVFPENPHQIYSVKEVLNPTTFEVNVGVSSIHHDYEQGGTASKVTKFDVKLANLKFECPPYGNQIDVRNFLYDNTTGNSLVTLDKAHSLIVGDTIKLQDLKFQCPPYGNEFGVVGADYNTTNGLITIDLNKAINGARVGDNIRVKGLQFDCDSGETSDINLIRWQPGPRRAILTVVNTTPGIQVGQSIKLTDLEYRVDSVNFAYPDGRDESLNIYKVLSVAPTDALFQPPNSVDVIVNFPLLNAAGLVFVDDGNSYGNLTVGITTNIFPETTLPEGSTYEILALQSSSSVTINVGINSIPHNYVRFGSVFTGVTTNIFPSPDPINSPKGNLYEVLDIPTPNQLRINVGPSSITHVYDEGGQLFTGITTNIFPDGTSGDIFPVISVTDPNVLTVKVGTSTIPHIYDGGGEMFTGITTNIFPGNKQNSPKGSIFTVLSKDDMCGDRFTIDVGISSINHVYVEGGTVTTGVTTDKFPDGTNGFRFPVLNVINNDYFNVRVGPSTITHTYIDGGYVRKYESPIRNFVYNNVTGDALVTTLDHNLNVGDLVKLRDIKFDCDAYGTEKNIVGFNYDNTTGRATVTTQEAHGLSQSETIKLANIQMDCAPYGNQKPITDAFYDNSVGSLLVQTATPHGLGINDNVKLAGLNFTCSNSGITTTIFPDGTAASLNIYRVDSIFSSNAFSVNVGVSTITHIYGGGGDIFVGITTNIFPGSSRNSPKGSFYGVLDTPSSNSFVVDVGLSSITHSYVRGGIVQVGVTTDIFPDGTQCDFFRVENVLSDDQFIINSGISSIVHRYNSGGFMSKYATYQSKLPQVVDTSVIRSKDGCVAVEARINQLAGIVTSIINDGPSAAPGGTPLDVTSANYTKNSGALSIRVSGIHNLKANDVVDVRNLTFQCSKVSNVSAATYDNITGVAQFVTVTKHGLKPGESISLEGLEFACNDGSLVYPTVPGTSFAVKRILSDTSFELQLDPSDKVHVYVSGGIARTQPSTRIYPDNKVFLYFVDRVLSPDTFEINVGPSEIDHTYVFGGTVKPGVRFDVGDADYDTTSGVLEIFTTEEHGFISGTGVRLNDLSFSCPSGGPENAPRILKFPDFRAANVVGSTYNNVTGLLSVTTDKPHQLFRNAKVRLSGLEFSCPGGSLIYPNKPEVPFKVINVINDFTYEIQLKPSTKVHTYVAGGISDAGPGFYKITGITGTKSFTIQMGITPIPHTYVGGGTAGSIFTAQELQGINLRTAKCAEDVSKVYLAVVHDITRGGNWKSSEAAKRYYDALGQIKFIAGGEINQTVDALDFSLNIVRCIINNVSWGGVPRGYFTSRESRFIPTSSNLTVPAGQRSLSRDLLRLIDFPVSTSNSVVKFQKPFERGQYTTEKKFITDMLYNNITGIASITTTKAHRLIKYDAVELSDIQMSCVGSPRITTNIFPDGTQGDIFEVINVIQDNPIYPVTNASYDNVTGNMLVESAGSQIDLEVGTLVNLRNLRFECTSTGIPRVLTYPENSDYVYRVASLPTDDSIIVNVGVSTLVHSYRPGTTSTNIPQFQELPRKFTTHVGTVNFPHIYDSGGIVWKQEPFSRPATATQLRDVSIQNDPLQLTNSTPNACANVFSAIENAVGVVTTIIALGPEEANIPTRYPGNNGKGVDTFEEMSSQGVGNIVKGPYIRNCTNFVPKSIGMRMDGFDAEPGDEISNGVQGSSNVDSFTQFNPGGIGCSVSNGTYQQLVSIFTICCDQAIVCDSGAQLDLTNSNSSFGRLGLVARGIGDAKSKCIDRYTGIVAEEAQIEDDAVIIRGIGNKRPYDGQGIFFGELFREVIRIDVTDQGSGYDDFNPPNALVALPTGPSGIKAEVSPTVLDGKVVSIEIISNGNQYRDVNPVVTIDPPKSAEGRQAKAIAITEPLYYDVDSSSEPFEGTVRVVFKQRLNNTVSTGTTVFFSRLSLQIASSHSFEYIGAGNEINGARPSQGGVPIKANEIIKEEGGSIVYTSTDQAGNFNIGDDFIINQFTGTVTGRSFDQSVLNKVTPLIIALDS